MVLMEKYKYIFVVLVYRNFNDAKDLILNIKEKVSNYKIVLVNSYYDDYSMTKLKQISVENNCDFINIQNKGYGYGNNQGIKHAKNKYYFEYLIVANPDIEIKKFDEKEIDKYAIGLFGPVIKTLKGKNQNPYWVKEMKILEKLRYFGFRNKSNFFIYFTITINKIYRSLFLLFFRIFNIKQFKVFAIHGCFLIFPYSILKGIDLLYDEKIFLFSEEADIAHELKKRNIKTYITKGVEIKHKEDGSIKYEKINERQEERKSIIYYYEKVINS